MISFSCLQFLAIVSACVLFFPTGHVAAQENANHFGPNIVVFLVDDMGVMDSSVPFLTDKNGQPKRYPLNNFYCTPSMERLASQGIRFNNFYAMSVCSPSRVSIMTGQNAARHHTTQWISPEQRNGGDLAPPKWNWKGLNSHSMTMPRLLQSAGYRTIHVGKAHFGPFDSEGDDPVNLGFDINVGGRAIGAPGSYFGKDNYGNRQRAGQRRKGRDRAVPHLEKHHGSDTHLTEALTIEAMTHVKQAVADQKPFFLHLAHYAVHSPHQSDPRFAKKYAHTTKSKRAQAFATLVEGMDHSLGQVMDRLEQMGVADNTLILFLGDNGSDAPLGHEHAVASSAPLRGKKGSHYEGGVRVPFIAAWAKANPHNPAQKSLPIPPGQIQTQMANVCDLMPTICRLARVKIPTNHSLDGQTLAKLLMGQADADHSNQFLMHFPHSPHRSEYFTTLRDGDWKIAYHYYPGKDSSGKRYQLFNLADDPFEQTDLADVKPEKLSSLVSKLAAKLDACNAQYVIDKADPPKRLRPELPVMTTR